MKRLGLVSLFIGMAAAITGLSTFFIAHAEAYAVTRFIVELVKFLFLK